MRIGGGGGGGLPTQRQPPSDYVQSAATWSSDDNRQSRCRGRRVEAGAGAGYPLTTGHLPAGGVGASMDRGRLDCRRPHKPQQSATWAQARHRRQSALLFCPPPRHRGDRGHFLETAGSRLDGACCLGAATSQSAQGNGRWWGQGTFPSAPLLHCSTPLPLTTPLPRAAPSSCGMKEKGEG